MAATGGHFCLVPHSGATLELLLDLIFAGRISIALSVPSCNLRLHWAKNIVGTFSKTIESS
jgi:hypothetical protein